MASNTPPTEKDYGFIYLLDMIIRKAKGLDISEPYYVRNDGKNYKIVPPFKASTEYIDMVKTLIRYVGFRKDGPWRNVEYYTSGDDRIGDGEKAMILNSIILRLLGPNAFKRPYPHHYLNLAMEKICPASRNIEINTSIDEYISKSVPFTGSKESSSLYPSETGVFSAKNYERVFDPKDWTNLELEMSQRYFKPIKIGRYSGSDSDSDSEKSRTDTEHFFMSVPKKLPENTDEFFVDVLDGDLLLDIVDYMTYTDNIEMSVRIETIYRASMIYWGKDEKSISNMFEKIEFFINSYGDVGPYLSVPYLEDSGNPYSGKILEFLNSIRINILQVEMMVWEKFPKRMDHFLKTCPSGELVLLSLMNRKKARAYITTWMITREQEEIEKENENLLIACSVIGEYFIPTNFTDPIGKMIEEYDFYGFLFYLGHADKIKNQKILNLISHYVEKTKHKIFFKTIENYFDDATKNEIREEQKNGKDGRYDGYIYYSDEDERDEKLEDINSKIKSFNKKLNETFSKIPLLEDVKRFTVSWKIVFGSGRFKEIPIKLGPKSPIYLLQILLGKKDSPRDIFTTLKIITKKKIIYDDGYEEKVKNYYSQCKERKSLLSREKLENVAKEIMIPDGPNYRIVKGITAIKIDPLMAKIYNGNDLYNEIVREFKEYFSLEKESLTIEMIDDLRDKLSGAEKYRNFVELLTGFKKGFDEIKVPKESEFFPLPIPNEIQKIYKTISDLEIQLKNSKMEDRENDPELELKKEILLSIKESVMGRYFTKLQGTNKPLYFELKGLVDKNRSPKRIKSEFNVSDYFDLLEEGPPSKKTAGIMKEISEQKEILERFNIEFERESIEERRRKCALIPKYISIMDDDFPPGWKPENDPKKQGELDGERNSAITRALGKARVVKPVIKRTKKDKLIAFIRGHDEALSGELQTILDKKDSVYLIEKTEELQTQIASTKKKLSSLGKEPDCRYFKNLQDAFPEQYKDLQEKIYDSVVTGRMKNIANDLESRAYSLSAGAHIPYDLLPPLETFLEEIKKTSTTDVWGRIERIVDEYFEDQGNQRYEFSETSFAKCALGREKTKPKDDQKVYGHDFKELNKRVNEYRGNSKEKIVGKFEEIRIIYDSDREPEEKMSKISDLVRDMNELACIDAV